jgi:chromosome segregation ATPase
VGGGTPIPNRLDPNRAEPSGGDGGLADRQRDFERLESAVIALARRHQQTIRDNEKLRREIEERDRRIRALESETLELNQRRRDVAKRIDDLLAQIDQIDAQVAAGD